MIYDAIVIGLGAMGSAALAQSAARRLRVLGIERFGRAHTNGSSGGKTRLIRQAYFEDPAYVPLLLRAYECWRALEARTGIPLLRITGLLMAGHAQSRVLAGSRESAALHGLPVEVLDARDMLRRFPAVRPLPGEMGVYEALGGILACELGIAAHLDVAEAEGAQMLFDTAVGGWHEDVGGIFRVDLPNGESARARRLVLCEGAWSDGFPISVLRVVQHWFAPSGPPFGPETCPPFLLDRQGFEAPLYGFPDLGDGVKAAFHPSHGVPIDADALERCVLPGEALPVQSALDAWMPGSAGSVLDEKVCMYAMTPDEHFILGAHPAHPQAIVAAGFSGHGYKFASVVGEVIADLLTAGGTRHDVSLFSPARFVRAGERSR